MATDTTFDPSLLWGTNYYNKFGGSLVPSQLPIFSASDLVYNPATPGGRTETESGSIEQAGSPASWNLNSYGNYGNSFPDNTAFFIDPSFTPTDANSRPSNFNFGIKTGHDQGRLANYTLQTGPDGKQYYMPTGDYGIVGGRHGLFDSNAYTRDNNITAAKYLAAFLAMGAGAYAAGAGEAGAAAGAGGTDAGYLAAADAAGGLVPAYGTNAGYAAGVAGGGAATAAPISLPAGSAPTAIEGAAPGAAGGAAGAGAGSGAGTGGGSSAGNGMLGNLSGKDWVNLGMGAVSLIDGLNGRDGNPGPISYSGTPMNPLSSIRGQMPAPQIPFTNAPGQSAAMWNQYAGGLLGNQFQQPTPGQPQQPMPPNQQPMPPQVQPARPVSSTGPIGDIPAQVQPAAPTNTTGPINDQQYQKMPQSMLGGYGNMATIQPYRRTLLGG